MPADIVMPRLSDTMESGTVARWLKHEGDTITKGEPIADIETDKAMMPLEADVSGTISKILLPEGESAPIGTTIAIVAKSGEAAVPRPAAPTPAATPTAPPSAPARPAEPVAEPVAAPSIPSSSERLLVSPVARRLAEEMHIDLRSVVGTGPNGRITREDVEAVTRVGQAQLAPAEVAKAGPPPAVAALGTVPSVSHPLTRLQETVARRMVQSKTTVPHFYLTTEIDMAAAARLRGTLNAEWTDAHVGFTDLLVRAVALALEAFPLVNASWQQDHLDYHEAVNVGLAVATEGGGLLVPVIKRANQSGLRQLSVEIKDLVKRTREGKNRPGDFEGGTFTISNLGAWAIDNFLAIINPPESAILAVGRIEKRPVARGDQIVLSERVNLSLSCDHRVFYGAYGAEFMTKLRDLLEQPYSLLS
ncbi:MAG TPA: dihydrolipoamide acetyltransferase family protein [Chloroflexota bacterium]|nr:dihydrolipoamide acetyltransferase family protein [Chloroflexota bacterium]